jgi:hypothetical protein
MCGVDMDSLATPTGTIVDAPKMAAMRNAADALVYVNEDGSVRELTEAEKKYVDTEFSPLDGARPYVKSRIRVTVEAEGLTPLFKGRAIKTPGAPPQGSLSAPR